MNRTELKITEQKSELKHLSLLALSLITTEQTTDIYNIINNKIFSRK
jgi:hypothetical protein